MHVLKNFGRHVKVLLRVEAEHLLQPRDLFRAKRRTVHTARVLLRGRRPPDDRRQRDDRWLARLGLCVLDCGKKSVGVLLVAVRGDPVHALRVPAVCLVALEDVFSKGNVRLVLNGDLVVVPDHDEVAELLNACKCRRFSGDALLKVAVRRNDINVVIEHRGAGGSVGVKKAPLAARCHRHTDR